MSVILSAVISAAWVAGFVLFFKLKHEEYLQITGKKEGEKDDEG